jgi:pimeloyl-ACP methyl ester carboxylesterase
MLMIYKSRFGDIYYELSGPKEAPLVALCHGVGMDHQTFRKQVGALQGEFQVMIWDLPGHGRSTMTNHDKRFSQIAAECLVGLLDETNIDRAVLGGLSLGSFVIQHVLSEYPERVVATFHIGGLTLYPKYSSLLKPVFLMTDILRIMPSKLFYSSFAKHRANTEETRQYLEDAISKTGKDLVLKITRDMGADMIEGVPEPPVRPLLITYGEDDIYTRGLSEKWHRRIPGSHRAVISKANHIANQDNGDEFNKTLLSFLQSLENTSC